MFAGNGNTPHQEFGEAFKLMLNYEVQPCRRTEETFDSMVGQSELHADEEDDTRRRLRGNCIKILEHP